MRTNARNLVIFGLALVAFIGACGLIGKANGGDIGLIIGEILGVPVGLLMGAMAIVWIDREQGY
jgi:hypothetical protein